MLRVMFLGGLSLAATMAPAAPVTAAPSTGNFGSTSHAVAAFRVLAAPLATRQRFSAKGASAPTTVASTASPEASSQTPVRIAPPTPYRTVFEHLSRDGSAVFWSRHSVSSARLFVRRLPNGSVRSFRLPSSRFGRGQNVSSGNGRWHAYHVGKWTGRREGGHPVVSVQASLINVVTGRVLTFANTRIHALSETGRYMLIQRVDEYVERPGLRIGRGPDVERTSIVDRRTQRRTPGPRVRRKPRSNYILGSSLTDVRLSSDGGRVTYGVRKFPSAYIYFSFRRGARPRTLGPYLGLESVSVSSDARTVLLKTARSGLALFRDGRKALQILPNRSDSSSAAVGASNDAPLAIACAEGSQPSSSLYLFDPRSRRWAEVAVIDDEATISIFSLRVVGDGDIRYGRAGVSSSDGKSGFWQVDTSASRPLGRAVPDACV